jgi:hypothetical protein
LPLLHAVRRLTISPARFPLPPATCLLATRFAAVARQWLVRPEDLPAALQQAKPASRATSPSPAALGSGNLMGLLILVKGGRIFIRAHGSGCSQKLKPRRGCLPLRGTLGSELEPHLPYLKIQVGSGVGQIWRARPVILGKSGVRASRRLRHWSCCTQIADEDGAPVGPRFWCHSPRIYCSATRGIPSRKRLHFIDRYEGLSQMG